MKIEKLALWIIVGLLAVFALSVAGRFIAGLLGLALVVFVIGLLVNPEGTKAYALRVIGALDGVLKGITASLKGDSTKDDPANKK